MRKLFDRIAISRVFWIVCFVLTVWLMVYNGVWTAQTPAEPPTPIEITE